MALGASGAEALDAESLEWERARAEGGAWGGRGRGGRAVARQFASLSTRTRHVRLSNLHLAYAGKELLSGAELSLQPGRRYALLGRNGVGKSTLLRQLAAGALPGFPLHLRVAHLPQDEAEEGAQTSGAQPAERTDVPAADDTRPPLARLLALGVGSQRSHLEAEREQLEAALDELADELAALGTTGEAGADLPGAAAERERAAAELGAAAERLGEIEQALEELGHGGDQHDGGARRARALLAGLGFRSALDEGGTGAGLDGTRDGCDRSGSEAVADGGSSGEDEGDAAGEQWTPRAAPCMDTTPTRELSGGWRMRLRLAAALLSGADLLMLDEPTNHLDLHAALWLQALLAADGAPAALDAPRAPNGAHLSGLAECILLFVSHDRAFTGAVATDVLCFESDSAGRGSLRHFRGDLALFEQAEAEAAAQLGARLDARARQEAAARASADALRATAQRARGTDGGGGAARQARQKAAKVERIGLYRDDGKAFKLNSLRTMDARALRLPQRADASQLRSQLPEPPFRFPTPPRHGGLSDADDALVTLDGAAVGYAPGGDGGSAAPVLRGLTLAVRARARVAVVGPNGQGKSTLLRLILGELPPCEGAVRARPGVRIAYAPQHLAEALDPHAAEPAARYVGGRFGVGELEVRTRLGRFGLGGSTALLPISALSGGQRVRLALACLCWDAPHALLLDEPTNHLDLEAVDALAAGLRAFAGAVVLVSHNRHLCAQLCDELWLVERGGARRVLGDAPDDPFCALFASYEARVMAAARARVGAHGGMHDGATARAAARMVRDFDATAARSGGKQRGAAGKRGGGAGASRSALL